MNSATNTNTPSSPKITVMNVSSPTAGASVSSPFPVSATATSCQSETVSTIGYSIDQGTVSTVNGTALDVQANAAAGPHTLHVIATAADGTACAADVSLTVSATATTGNSSSGPSLPANATTVSEIQQLPNWQAEFDSGSGSGSSSGVMALVSTPSQSGSALELQTSFANSGGERYHVSFGSDPLAANFVYDGWVDLASPAASIANIEMDMNQVVANGETVIYGFQCDGYSNTWDITENSGTPAVPQAHWIHTSSSCNPQSWTTDSWHHVQVQFSRDDAGNVTYKAVWFDGTEQDINQTVPSSFALGWASVLLTNFQIDGLGASGSNTVYVDSLSISRW